MTKLSIEDARKQIRFADSYNRLGMICALFQTMDVSHWFRLLGEEWSGCDNTYRIKSFLKWVSGASTQRELMSDAELEAFEKLPAVITIYRGCGRGVNMDGISWSLCKQVASEFPTHARYAVKRPVVITATVRKEKVVALKLDRDEKEVITFSAKRQLVEEIDLALP